MLNNAGRDVFIKVIITTIPTYAVRVFKLPITWTEINVMIAQFWWGGSDSSQNIQWKHLEVMTRAKQHGGMKFKELKIFNLRLLTRWLLGSSWDLMHSG